MDVLSISGLILGFVAILGASYFKHLPLSALYGPAAFMIVFVGTCAATFVHTPVKTFKKALSILVWVVKPPASNAEGLIASVIEWSNISRRQGLLGLEAQIAQQPDPFIKKGLQMLIDGVEPEAIRNMLEIDLQAQEHTETAAAKVFESAGIYAPTLGIIGAVLGLMAVMQSLNDPSKLGLGISAAFVATVYGIGSANLFLLPIAAKLKSVVARRISERELIIEGLIAIAQGENPRNIESKLSGFVH